MSEHRWQKPKRQPSQCLTQKQQMFFSQNWHLKISWAPMGYLQFWQTERKKRHQHIQFSTSQHNTLFWLHWIKQQRIHKWHTKDLAFLQPLIPRCLCQLLKDHKTCILIMLCCCRLLFFLFLLDSFTTYCLDYNYSTLVFTGHLWDNLAHNIRVNYETYSPDRYNTHQATQVRRLTATDEHNHSK